MDHVIELDFKPKCSKCTGLPSIFDNVYFNGNSNVNDIITLNDLVDLHEFIVEPSFIGKSFEIASPVEGILLPFVVHCSYNLIQ